jgi:outer membrane lipoprotein SlyB
MLITINKGVQMKTRYLLCAAAIFAVAACTKSDSTPAADTSLSLNGAATTPLDSINAAERANAAAATAPVAAPVAVAPAGVAPSRTHTTVHHTSSSTGRSEPVYTSGTATTASTPTLTVKNTKRDAVIGGVAGAAIGAATGGGVKGAVIGGAAGAVLGGVIGNNVDVKKKH